MPESASKPHPATERSHRYREFARETLKLAELAARPELKATYLSLSTCWASLAREAESAARRASRIRQISAEQDLLPDSPA